MTTERENFLQSIIVVDTETTSAVPEQAELVELGYAIKTNAGWMKDNELYKPFDPIPPEASEISHISNKMVEDCEHFVSATDSCKNVVETCSKQGVLMLAHNAQYDRKVLDKYEIAFNDELCTLALARKLFYNDESVTKFTLSYLRYRFDLEPDEENTAHRAGDDCIITGLLIEHLLDVMEEQGIIEESVSYYDQIVEYLSQPTFIEKMPFGKHKGVPMEDIPMDYWTWALDKLDSLNEEHDNYDADFAYSVAIVIEAKLQGT